MCHGGDILRKPALVLSLGCAIANLDSRLFRKDEMNCKRVGRFKVPKDIRAIRPLAQKCTVRLIAARVIDEAGPLHGKAKLDT